MIFRRLLTNFTALLIGFAAVSSPAASPVPFEMNDVIALAGGANLERTRFNGHLHAQLIATDPSLRLRVRNLAWEGDTVFEQWRDEGKEQWRLSRDWTQLLADHGATVVLAQFGQMEALGGTAKLDAFIAAYGKLLDDFSANGRRVVLVSPVPFERTASVTLRDLSPRNADARQYTDAIRALAAKRKLAFVDLFTPLSGHRGALLTDNGYQLNEYGRAVVAEEITRQLGLTPKPAATLVAVRAAAVEFERLWFDYYRPHNWSFLEGDRTHVPFSRDWRDQNVRLFPEEMKEFNSLLRDAEDNIRRAFVGELLHPLTPPRTVPTEPPPTPSQTPAGELATLKVHPDYELSLFASEADGVAKPLQIRWDERGRLWVLCPVSYPQVRPGEKANDRIVICEDSNGDGRADVFTTFADGLNMPTGFELGDGGAYVTQGTDLWHLRDTSGDGKADARRLMLGGFGTGDSHQMINCLSWGFGGELWFTQGHHIWSRVETPYGVEHLNRSGVWRMRPRTLRLDPFFQMSSAGANCWGVMTDDFGQVFHKTGADNGGFYSVPGLIRTDLALPSEVLRLFQARVKTVGFDFVNTRHFPDDLQGTVAVGGFYDNTLQLHKLDCRDGVFSSQQIAALVETTNKVFRPVDVRVGPDGAIYFADWYNPIIGHYQASYRHPDRDKDHGRVWRLKRKDRALVKPVWLTSAKTEELFAQLDSPERWAKYQAKRLLFERDTKEVIAALDRWVKSLQPGDARDEYLRLQALSLFEAHETQRPDLLKSLLRSPDFRVRAYATRVLSNWARAGGIPDALKWIEQQAADEHPRVRLEAVVASSYLDDPAAVTVAARVLDRPMDKYLDYALAKAVHASRPRWEPLLAGGQLNFAKDEHLLFVLKDARLDNAPALIRQQLDRLGADAAKSRPWLLALAAVGDANDLQIVLNRAGTDTTLLDALGNAARTRKAIPAGDHAAFVTRLLDASSDADRQRGVRLAGLWSVKPLTARIQTIAADPRADLALRTEAFESLAGLTGKDALPALQRAFNQAASSDVALAALESIARLHQGIAANLTLGRLKAVTNAAEAGRWLRPLLTRATGAGALANALAADDALPAAQAKFTLSAFNNAGRSDKKLVERLSQLAGFSADLPAYSADYVREIVAGSQAASTTAGRQVYDSLGCATCHTINNAGGKTGPDLSALGRGLPVDMIVTELIWPQLNVKEGFEAVRVSTRDADIVEGFRQSETTDEIALRDLLTGGITKVPRARVATVRSIGSPMPEGLTVSLTKQQLADLIRYLADLGK